MSKILALDYGDKRIGVATSDPSGTIASPLAVIENQGKAKTISTIKGLCQEHSIVRIVIGVPYSLNNRETEQTTKTKDFIAKLERAVQISVEEVDERFSSVLAEKQLAGQDRKVDKGEIDAAAAQILLQDYLDRE
ncbi:MAG: Holliday junction resolvase RuvX [Parcubacteria group bacterium]